MEIEIVGGGSLEFSQIAPGTIFLDDDGDLSIKVDVEQTKRHRNALYIRAEGNEASGLLSYADDHKVQPVKIVNIKLEWA
jgi:hypothetical protein